MTSDLSKGKTHFLGDQSPPGTKKGVGTGETGMVSTMRDLPDPQGIPTLAAAQKKDPGLRGYIQPEMLYYYCIKLLS